MLQVQNFIQENTQALREIRSLEYIRIKERDPVSSARVAVRKIYTQLLGRFENAFPRVHTTMHLLYWGFIRTRIAGTYLETREHAKANEILRPIFLQAEELKGVCSLMKKLRFPEQEKNGPQYNSSDIVLLSNFAGLFQTVFNLMAASLAGTGKKGEDNEHSPVHWLHCAKRVHELYVEHNLPHVGPTFWETITYRDFLGNVGDNPGEMDTNLELSPERLLFEHGYTSTVFLLAQAYQLINEPRHAAACCQLTLSRQLTFAQPFQDLVKFATPRDGHMRPRGASARRAKDTTSAIYCGSSRRLAWSISLVVRPFDPVEWAENAAALSNYYSSVEDSNNYYYNTLECLVSASAILDGPRHRPSIDIPVVNRPRGQSSHREARARANVYRALSKLGLVLLQKGSEAIAENPEVLMQVLDTGFKSSASEAAKDFGGMFQLDLRGTIWRLMGFGSVFEKDALSDGSMVDSVSNPDNLIDDLATCPVNYTSASHIFRMVFYCLSRAESYYKMDEYCSDAVSIIQDKSKAYKYLTTFELNPERQCRMLKRRIDMLENVTKTLSRVHYQMLCRELLSELGEAVASLSDLKRAAYEEAKKAGDKSAVHYAKKANTLTRRALDVYKDFLLTFRRPSQNLQPHVFSEVEIRPFLQAYLYSARLHSRIIPTDVPDRINNISRSLNQYKHILTLAEGHVKRNPFSTLKQTEEVRIAEEMVALLPAKIHRLSRGEPVSD
ncbi:unnamed protein product [Calicophoron daubneyi]|uniref:KIF-binding protein n=1 Tax=Calicophoron daubneyi TaxID=300641 RepID=A0AAV2TG42_CALDB